MHKNTFLKTCFIILAFLVVNLTIAQSSASKSVSSFLIDAPQLDTIKKIWVYLPKTYTPNAKKYPVLYLQDAQNLFDRSTSYSGEWKVDETLDSLDLPLIVIGIEHGNEKRIDELTPYPHPEYKGGKADAYLDFILNTLKPKIDSLYNTSPTAKNTFIGGSSLGGLFAYYATLKHPDIFGKALVFSPSFWYSEDIFNLTESAELNSLSKNQFYFRAGEKESETMVPLMLKMKELLSSKQISEAQINIEAVPNGEHNEAFWASLFPEAALWLMDLEK
ncbi:putative alpha/beta superfamily hydrolase [Gillisia mitskevichiae]|uniref:Putative alpha/beta superfamily hydrolase n=1 Tax=Gillisia mitskevichiae TaxID=270921 RepID=A0A495PS80_9FLAO|nr:alpha/beta hydrolase-fold protein [Gillisia mitskevichiae]RKS53483.1 putative alpha/beta superfamily hydrolase [Gillisia mitskevichiae]